MDLAIQSVVEALGILADPVILVFVLVGVLWGTTMGALPGAGGGVALGVVVPITFGMDAISAVVLLIAINVAVAFGNGLPATLLGIPTSPASIFTAVEGYELAKKGQGNRAVAANWFGCFTGQFISIPFFVLLVVPLSTLTYTFLSPELFALYALGMSALIGLTGENILKGLAAAAIGVILAAVGSDPVSAVGRFEFGVPQLRNGIPTIPAVLGLITVGELIKGMRQSFGWDDLVPGEGTGSTRFPGFGIFRRVARNLFTGSLIGTVIGAIPGLSGTAAAVISYNQAKLTSKSPEEFGRGSIEGVVANEAAQNASQAGEMAPTLGLGIPGSDSMVLVLGALLLQGFVPGPQMMQAAPELLFATVAGLIGGATVLFLFGWPLGKTMLRATRTDRRVVLPLAFIITLVGVFALRRAVFDVLVLLIAGIIGYFMIRYGYPPIAAGVALILGPGFEENLRLGLLLEDGNVIAFLTRPWTAAILLASLALLAYGAWQTIRGPQAKGKDNDIPAAVSDRNDT